MNLQRRLCAILSGAGLFVLLSGCGGDGQQLPPPGQINVLLICIDTLSADRLGCYTPGEDTSPRLDALAAESVLFRRAHSTSSWTQPAVASLMTGLMPSDNGAQRFRDSLPAEQTTLAERCRDAGLATAAVVSNPLVGATYGFDQGFDHFDESHNGHGDAITSDLVTDSALEWLDDRGESPFFLFVHYLDPHNDYVHHPDFDRTAGYKGRLRPGIPILDLRKMRPKLKPRDVRYLVNLHREEIAFTDHHIGRLLDGLAARGLSDSTVVILTSDHGEEFMERGWIGHTTTLFDELVMVPLMVRLPGVLTPRIVEQNVSLVDVVPTLFPAADIDPAGGNGRSLGPLLYGDEARNRDLFAEVTFWPLDLTKKVHRSEKHTFKTSLVAGDLKLVHDLRYENWGLYDRAADPHEKTNLYGQGHEAETGLRERLTAWEQPRRAAWLRAQEDFPTPDPATVKQLKSLGYVD